MDPRHAQRIEAIVDVGAAAILAAAAGYAVGRFASFGATILAAAAAAFFISWRTLRAVASNAGSFPIAHFELIELAGADIGELLLTDDDRLETQPALAGADELVLDDVLAKLGEESRVVRLFDVSAMPTAGQLKARIDQHLGDSHPPSSSPDASGALHQALAELRRSLR
jgi:hypothetical protein